jgi:rhodanese-related sulfurtransferase
MRISPLLLPSLAALALAACSQGDGKEDRENSPSLSYELAVANGDSSGVVETHSSSVVDLTPAQLRAKLDAGDIRLIDVRTAEEVAEGMILGAEHIPLDQFDPAKLGLDDGREVVLYCRSGRRSEAAAERLTAHTGKPAEHLAGGILAWQESGGPVE